MGCKEVHVVHLATGTGSLAHRQLEVSELTSESAPRLWYTSAAVLYECYRTFTRIENENKMQTTL